MKIIKYKVLDGTFGLTDCPYNDPDDPEQFKVGSVVCSCCEGFVDVDEEKQIVRCVFDEILKRRKVGKDEIKKN